LGLVGTPEDALRAAEEEDLAAAEARSEHARDQLTILSGTGQNIVGLGVFVLASFGMNILIARAFGGDSAAFGQITLITQLAFVAGAATRFGMDMAAVRRVAIDIGQGHPGRVRSVVRIAAGIALVVSVVVALIVFAFAGPLGELINSPAAAMRAAAFGLIFVAIAQVFMGGSRGLKIMRHTLYAYWIGQSLGWIVITLVLWAAWDRSVAVTVFAYSLSWVLATAIALVSWRHATRTFTAEPIEPGEARALVRYGAPRAPAALLSQALFYADLAVLLHYDDGPSASVYAATIRVAQSLVLFLTAVSYMFSPFVADLYERGERDRLNSLFKSITRWTLGGTIPLLLLFLIAPGPVLHVFGAEYDTGDSWLRILLIGQTVNVSVGAAGFILIMVGRTGWDLAVYAASFALDLAVALTLVPKYGPLGAAIAQTTALVFSNALRLYLVWRFVRIQPYDRYYARLLIPTVIGGAAMIAIHSFTEGPHWGIDLLATGIIGGAVYYAAFLLFGLTPQEKKGALTMVSKLKAKRAASGV
jgi:O-antigen/teichoic acid export membrane protein